MKEELRLDGFVNNTLWGDIKCFFGNHFWMCETPINEYGRYMNRPQEWVCRRCCRYKRTYHVYSQTN